ncbi:uncharacterized protein [Dermacentor albipictus]|uniref:uncharacterized protein n=1 Tax=Dermacentor albipictus TaxID=60249 RepID=UPI0038FC997F
MLSGGVSSPPSREESRLRNLTVAVVALAIIFASASLVTLAPWPRSAKSSPTSCDTPGCQAFANTNAKSIRRDVPPCTDFAEFVCGGLAGENVSVRREAYEAFRNDLNTLQKAWVFYKNCEDVVAADVDNTKTLLGMMTEARLDWPARNARPDAVYSILYLQKYAGDRRRRLDRRADHDAFFNDLAKVFRKGKKSVAVVDDFEGTMLLEEAHIEAIVGRAGVGSGVAEAVVSDSGDGSAERWRLSLAEVFSERALSGSTRVAFLATDPGRFERLLKLVASNESNAVLLLGWRAAQEASQYGNCALALGYYRTEERPLKSYVVHCFDLCSDLMGQASIKHYVARHFTKAMRDDVTHIAQLIRRTFIEKLTNSVYDWQNLSVFYSLLDSLISPSLNAQFFQLPTLGASFPENLR